MIDSRRSFLKELRNLPEKLNLRKKIRKIPEDPDVLNAQALGISWLIAGKAYNVTLSDESEEESPESEKFLAFVAPHVEEEDSYYSEHSDNEEELKEAYKTLYIEYEKLREGRKQPLNDLNSLQTEKSSLLLKVQELEENLLETQFHLERVTDEKLTRMLSI
jgi:hypothetical protein